MPQYCRFTLCLGLIAGMAFTNTLTAADPAPLAIAGISTASGTDARDAWIGVAIEETLAWRLRRVPGVLVMPTIRVHQAWRELREDAERNPDFAQIARLLGGTRLLTGSAQGHADATTLKLELVTLAGGVPNESTTIGPAKLFDVISEATAWSLTKLNVPSLDAATQALVLAAPSTSPSALEYFARAVIAVRNDDLRNATRYGEQSLTYDGLFRPSQLLLTQLEIRAKTNARATAAIRLKRLAEYARDIADPFDQADIEQIQGALHAMTGSFEAARLRYETSLSICERVGDVYGRLLILNRMSDAYLADAGAADSGTAQSPPDNAKLRKALEWQQRLTDELRALKDQVAFAPAAVKLALIHERLGEHQKALEWHQQVLGASEAVGSKRGQATAWMFLGQCQRTLNRPQEARDALLRCLALADESSRPMARVALAEIYQESGLNAPDEAIKQLELACRELENGDLNELLKALQSLAELRWKLNQRPDAIRTLQQALDVSHALNSRQEDALKRKLEAWKAGKTP